MDARPAECSVARVIDDCCFRSSTLGIGGGRPLLSISLNTYFCWFQWMMNDAKNNGKFGG